VYFLKNLETFDSIPSILNEPVFEKAFHTAELAAMSQKDRERYDANLKIYRDNMAVLKTARIEGKAEGMAKAIVSFLENRFGQVPASLVTSLSNTTDFERLESLLIKAARCASLEEFEAALR
jgi:hypothetical protein